MSDIKYVQLESSGFLSDPDFQLMNATERGVYCTVIFYMYLNDGKILNDPARIKTLTNCGESFEKTWNCVEKKFAEKNGYLTHKRVRKELAKAKKYFQSQRRAGLRGAEKRWGGHNNPNGFDITKPMANKTKESKIKQSKKKVKEKHFTPPTIQEISAYCKEKNIYIDPKDFIEFYGSKGWKVGKSKMMNWQLAVCRAVKWECNRDKQPPPKADPKKEQANLEKKRQEIRQSEEGLSYRKLTVEELKERLLNKYYLPRHWLIKEILKEKAK